MALAARDRTEDALSALEAAFEAGFREGWVLAAPLLDPLRDLSRFEALEARYRAAQEENIAAVLAQICSEGRPQFGWQPLVETCDGAAAASF